MTPTEKLIADTIRERGAMSDAQLTKVTGKQRSLICRVRAAMTRKGWLAVSGRVHQKNLPGPDAQRFSVTDDCPTGETKVVEPRAWDRPKHISLASLLGIE